eukprot:g25192.t1
MVVDAATGRVIAHQDAFRKWYPASLTKLMTAYVTFRALKNAQVTLETPVVMSKKASDQPASKMYLKPGSLLTLDSALKILLVKSANDIAVAVAETVGGSTDQFVAMMNGEAQRLGMSSTRFINPHGLPGKGQYTTARDLAVLATQIRREFPQYSSYFSLEGIDTGKKQYPNYNTLIGRFDGADGMKTGFICASGFNQVSSATRNGRTVISVVLGSDSLAGRADESADLLQQGKAVMAYPHDRIPVSIITGFLGAGKSTILNRMLRDPAAQDIAVIINEFGEVGIDNLLVEASGDSLVELSNGCLCCTVRGELVDTLASMMDAVQTGRAKPSRRVLIETTGLADPAPVMQSVMGNPVIAQNFELQGVVTVVDAVNGLATLDAHEEAVKQVAVADRLIIAKKTLATAAQLAALEARLALLNPRGTVLDADSREAGFISALDTGLYDPLSKLPDVDRWLRHESAADHRDHSHGHSHGLEHHHHHDHHEHDVNRHGTDIRSFSIVHDKPIDPMAVDMFVDLLRSAHGEKLLRMKAIVNMADNPDRPLVLHGVQTIFHPPQRLSGWPAGAERKTRMVLITKGLREEFVSDLFAAFAGEPRIDRPDRAALEDNPLAVPGLKR